MGMETRVMSWEEVGGREYGETELDLVRFSGMSQKSKTMEIPMKIAYFQQANISLEGQEINYL